MHDNITERTELIDTLYSDRINYTIIALTGYTSTGCSRLADLMSKKFEKWTNIRKPEDIKVTEPDILDNEDLMYAGQTNHASIAGAIFVRKYSLCHNFIQHNYSPFTVLKYSFALMFHTLCSVISAIPTTEAGKEAENKLINGLKSILKDKYRPSRNKTDDDYREIRREDDSSDDYSFGSEVSRRYRWMEVHDLVGFNFTDWTNLIIEFRMISKDEDKAFKDEAKLFFNNNGVFVRFMKEFNEYLWKKDSYCTDFFYHRLAFVIRATGDPTMIAHDVMKSDKPQGAHLYVVVKLINRLIKGFRRENLGDSEEGKRKGQCRIVIDKIRNSLEAKFLKERYSAFYLIAIHEEKSVSKHLKERLKQNYPNEDSIRENSELIGKQALKIRELDSIERSGSDFDRGRFFAQNLSQCVADAEIHISNEDGQGGDKAYFYSMSEQWMKYASLIQHPGLITPSSEERCMVVAYTAKFNSGCISRQVGAVITNKAHTIRTIGWNDVPYGQIPCSLRELRTMATGVNDIWNLRRYAYSSYETGDSKRFKDEQTFNEKVRIKYRSLHLAPPDNSLMEGMPRPYCFKSLQNEFEGEKNQVHIRALHAEENAMLQMTKYGGEGLHDGIIYVTASPCELCSKKLYQIGVRKIVYIDEYPGISRENIIASGYHRPKLKQFQGAYGSTYFKLYQPIIPYKEELAIRLGLKSNTKGAKDANTDLLKELLKIDIEEKKFTKEELMEKILKFKED